jgi:hypothetical protein
MRDRVIDLSGVASQEAHPMPLVLGKEAFNQLIIDIDFQHRKIAFYDPSGYSAPHDATRVALGHRGDARTVPISLEGAPAAPFDFDLGNAGTLIVLLGLPCSRPYFAIGHTRSRWRMHGRFKTIRADRILLIQVQGSADRRALRLLLRHALMMRSLCVTHDGRLNGCTIDVVSRMRVRDI